MSTIQPTCHLENFHIEVAKEKESEEICAIVNKAYEKDIFRQPPRTTIERVSQSFNEHHTWFVLKDTKDKKIIGTVLYSNEDAPQTSTQGNIHLLAVDSSYRGLNLGKKLLEQVENHAIEKKESKISLIAAKINTSLCSFYKDQGYKETGKTFILPNRFVLKDYKNEENGPDGESKVVFLHMEKDLKDALKA